MIYYDNRYWGLVYSSLLVLCHLMCVTICRPYNRVDVDVATALSDTCTILVLLSVALYQEGLMEALTMDLLMYCSSVLLVTATIVMHVWRECTVVRVEKEKTKNGVSKGNEHRHTGSAWGRRYNNGDSEDQHQSTAAKHKKHKKQNAYDYDKTTTTTDVVPFYEEEEIAHGGQDILFDASHMQHSHPNMQQTKHRMTKQNNRHYAQSSQSPKQSRMARNEKEIRFKLQAWYYRFSFVQRWHDSFRREHMKIPNPIDQAKGIYESIQKYCCSIVRFFKLIQYFVPSCVKRVNNRSRFNTQSIPFRCQNTRIDCVGRDRSCKSISRTQFKTKARQSIGDGTQSIAERSIGGDSKRRKSFDRKIQFWFTT